MRWLWGWLVVAVLALAGPALAEPNAKLEAAKKLIDALDFEAAAKLLNEAAEVPANERVVVLEILELKGIVWGSLGKPDKAREAFRTLLLLDPTYSIPKGQPPRVRTPFLSAKEQVGKSALTLEANVERSKDEGVEAVGVTMKGNASNLGQVLVFHLTVGEAPRTERVTPDAAGKARVKVAPERVRWWVQLLGEKDAVLIQLGSAGQPMEEAPPKVAQAPKTVEAPKARAPSPGVTSRPTSTWRRPTGLVLLGAGAVAAGLGAFFGYQSQDARNRVNAALASEGVITSLTHREAAALEAQARSKAPVANVLFAAGAAVGAAGLALTIVGAGSEVVLAPAPGGATISGRF